MIFGIKSKKDKRIEELENMLATMYLRQPQIVEQKGSVVPLRAGIRLAHDVPLDVAKDMVVKVMSESIKDKIHYEVDEVCGEMVINGYLNIVV